MPINMTGDEIADAVLKHAKTSEDGEEAGPKRIFDDADYVTENLVEALSERDVPRFKRSLRQFIDLYFEDRED